MGLRRIRDPTAPLAGNDIGPNSRSPGTGHSATHTVTTQDNVTPWGPRCGRPWGWKGMDWDVAKHIGEGYEPFPELPVSHGGHGPSQRPGAACPQGGDR